MVDDHVLLRSKSNLICVVVRLIDLLDSALEFDTVEDDRQLRVHEF